MLHWREWLHITNSRCARQHTDRNGRECGPRMDSPPLLDPKASSALRDRLRRNSRALARSRKLQLGPIGCAAPRAPWSRADAEYIEATFWQKLAEFEDRAGWATPQGPFQQIGSTAPPPVSQKPSPFRQPWTFQRGSASHIRSRPFSCPWLAFGAP
jgi:hypothetical protein